MEYVVLFILYVTIGNIIGNRYFRRRHGVRGYLGWGWKAFDAGCLGSAAVSVTWPVAMWLDSVRYPMLCDHGHHVLARESARADRERVAEALRREREA